MDTRYSVQNTAAPGSVGVPGITSSENVVESRAYSLAGILVGRGIIYSSPQFVLRMVGADCNVVNTFFAQDTRSKLVSRQRLHFVRERNRIFPFEVFLGLAIHQPINRHIDRDLIALHQVQLKEDQLGSARGEVEFVPIDARWVAHRRAAWCAGQRN